MKKIIVILSAWTLLASGAETSLESQLEGLSLPENQAPVGVSSEQMYSVQTRYTPLKNRIELSLGAGYNFNPGGFVSSRQFDAMARFYLSDRWFTGLGASYVSSSLNSAGESLIENEKLPPDLAYVKERYEFVGGVNVFYGKFRLSWDNVFYFDQYLSLGPALMNLDTGPAYGMVGDLGLALWLDRSFSLRLGVKDYFFNEKRRLGEGFVHHVLGHIEMGYIFL